MSIKDLFKKKTVITEIKTTTITTEESFGADKKEQKPFEKVAPEKIGVLDMVIAFDTTGSMSAYIDAVRQEVAELIPRLFKDNEDLRLGIVAFGDYCDMNNAQDFGDAYQCLMPTNNENDIIKFVRETRNTSGGDGDEFYELVIKKIVEETPWREGSTRAILLISDAEPHPLGYTYKDYVVGNQIDWRKEASKAAEMKIKIDTVTITDSPWYKELSKMTNGISVPFASGHKTARLVETATMARGSMKSREKFDLLFSECMDKECRDVFSAYKDERDKCDV
ncbi:MAG: VWA domain-containing protein [Bacteroidaceae bacterium]|nr:VWA domain-containing protein [Bacteroidaceae bacterium]